MSLNVSMTLNGNAVSAQVDARTLLVSLLRDQLGLTGTHVGCDTSQCGACLVHVNGRAVKACTMLAVQADGAEVKTVEASPAMASCIPCRKLSESTTVCNVAFARLA